MKNEPVDYTKIDHSDPETFEPQLLCREYLVAIENTKMNAEHAIKMFDIIQRKGLLNVLKDIEEKYESRKSLQL